jgi:hypothetical protein
MTTSHHNLPFLHFCLALQLVGCSGGDRAAVSGKVYLADGAELAGARVIAQPAKGGKAVYATTGEDGTFVLSSGSGDEGLMPGDYQVTVIENLGRGDADQRAPRKISAKYAEPSTSGLSFTVLAGESKELEFSLEAP